MWTVCAGTVWGRYPPYFSLIFCIFFRKNILKFDTSSPVLPAYNPETVLRTQWQLVSLLDIGFCYSCHYWHNRVFKKIFCCCSNLPVYLFVYSLCYETISVNCFFVCVYNRAGSVSVFVVGIGIRYFRLYFFHVGSVFGISILKYLGIGISEILVENSKFLVYPTCIWRPCWGWPRRNFPFGKLEWWGHQVMKKFDSKIGHFDTSTWQTDGHRTTAKTALWVASRGKHLCIQSLCCFNCLFLLYSTHKRLFGLIHHRKRLKKLT